MKMAWKYWYNKTLALYAPLMAILLFLAPFSTAYAWDFTSTHEACSEPVTYEPLNVLVVLEDNTRMNDAYPYFSPYSTYWEHGVYAAKQVAQWGSYGDPNTPVVDPLFRFNSGLSLWGALGASNIDCAPNNYDDFDTIDTDYSTATYPITIASRVALGNIQKNDTCVGPGVTDPAYRTAAMVIARDFHDANMESLANVCDLRTTHDISTATANLNRERLYESNGAVLSTAGSRFDCCGGPHCSPCDYSEAELEATGFLESYCSSKTTWDGNTVSDDTIVRYMVVEDCRFPLDVSGQISGMAPSDPNAVRVQLYDPDTGTTINVPHVSAGVDHINPNDGTLMQNQGWDFTDETRTAIQLGFPGGDDPNLYYCMSYLGLNDEAEGESRRYREVTTQVACDIPPGEGQICDIDPAVATTCSQGVQTVIDGELHCVEFSEAECPVPCWTDRHILGTSCEVPGEFGRCEEGVWQCCNAPYVDTDGNQYCDNVAECKSLFKPMPETCNGLDDDCDGFVDNIRRSWEKRMFSSSDWYDLRLNYEEPACFFEDECQCDQPVWDRHTYQLHWTDTLSGEAYAFMRESRNYLGVENTCTQAVSAGFNHNIAVRRNGTVATWGSNADGALGHSPTVSEVSEPTDVPGIVDAIAVAAGPQTSFVIKRDGTLYAWGRNANGELGLGFIGGSIEAPERVPNINNVMRVAALRDTTLALTANGRVYIANNTTGGAFQPISGLGDIVDITGGDAHYLALRKNGDLFAWGDNTHGQLGLGSTTPETSPQHITTLTDVVAIGAGSGYSFAILDDGSLYSWGSYKRGALGIPGAGSDLTTPTHVETITEPVVTVVGGEVASAAVTSDGSVWVWGDNTYGQLAIGAPSGADDEPKKVIDVDGIIGVSMSYRHILALRADGSLRAWGENNVGQLGIGYTSMIEATPGITFRLTDIQCVSPVQSTFLATFPGCATQVSGTEISSFAIADSGRVYAWGANYDGQLGQGLPYGDLPYSEVPLQVGNLKNITAIAAGASRGHVLALDIYGNVWSWGENQSGSLGHDSAGSFLSTPAIIQDLPSGDPHIINIAAGENFSLAADSQGNIWTWGNNDYGQLGDGTLSSRSAPESLGAPKPVSALVAGGHHVLLLQHDGRLYSWGRNHYGQLGLGNTDDPKSTPQTVSGAPFFSTVAAGANFSMGLEPNGRVWTWGQNNYGQLGNGSTDPDPIYHTPNPNGLEDMIAIAAGVNYALALSKDGAVFGWGLNKFGEVGPDTIGGPSPVPDKIPDLVDIVAISAGSYHGMALDKDGRLWTWGYNEHAQLGWDPYGSGNEFQPKPKPVKLPYIHCPATDPPTCYCDNAGDYIPPIYATITDLDCSGTTFVGTTPLIAGQPVSSLSAFVPYSGGNGGAYGAYNISSTGVTGLTLSTQEGTVNNGMGEVEFIVNGVPQGDGVASFEISLGSDICSIDVPVDPSNGVIGGFDCSGQSMSGTLSQGAPASGVTATLPYTGGNGGSFSQISAASDTAYGVGGLTATAAPGTLANGDGVLEFTITGTPDSSGSAYFYIEMNGIDCWLVLPVNVSAADIDTLNCGTPIVTGTLTENNPASGVSVEIPYLGGNGGPYGAVNISSSGIAGLTAAASAGNVAWGNGTLALGITGTPSSSGYAAFDLDFAGESCTFEVYVGYELIPGSGSVDPICESIGSGFFHSMARSSDDRYYTWGMATNGKLGHTTDNPDLYEPTEISGFSETIVATDGGHEHTLALAEDGRLWAWGEGASGQLGHGDDNDQWTPEYVHELFNNGENIIDISTKGFHTLALTDQGEVYAWGMNGGGQLGIGSDNDVVNLPTRVEGLVGTTIVDIATGMDHSIAINDSGQVFVWGNDAGGAVGLDEGGEIYREPRRLTALDGEIIVDVAAGAHNSFALTEDGRMFVWGAGAHGSLGIAPADHGIRLSPEHNPYIDGLGVVKIEAAFNHAFAITATGELYGWGWNVHGQVGLGHDSPPDVETPQLVEGNLAGKTVIDVTGGIQHTLALTSDGQIWSWGECPMGCLGLGEDTPVVREPREIPGLFGTTCGGATVSGLNCGGAAITGTAQAGVPAEGVAIEVPYTGGNGEVHDALNISSNGISGLFASTGADNLAVGNGSIILDVTGVAASTGTATFVVSLGGHSCPVEVEVESAFCGGSGTALDPWQICNVQSFLNIQKAGNLYLDDHFVLLNSLDLTGETVEPIGYVKPGERLPFTGSFDGNGHALNGISIQMEAENEVGLFPVLSGATIQNLTLANIDILGRNQVGGLAGHFDSTTIQNVHISGGTIKAQVLGSVGGLASQATSSILSDVSVNADIIASGTGNTGGLIGRLGSTSEIYNASSSGTVTGFNSTTGGLVGILDASLMESSTSYSVVSTALSSSGTSISGTGGLIGEAYNAIVRYSSAHGQVTGFGKNIGGLVGLARDSSNIQESFATGNVDGTYDGIQGSTNIGGLVGLLQSVSKINNAYATGSVGSVPTAHENIGGLVGFNDDGIISYAYGTGEVQGLESDTVGGLIGHNNSSTTDSYWDHQTSNELVSDGGDPLKTSDFTFTVNFPTWDFSDIWVIGIAPDTHTRPVFQWQPAGPDPSAFCGGDGTVGNPFKVCTDNQLNLIGTSENYLNKHFILENDIDMSGIGSYNIIGSGSSVADKFTGSFDGAGYTISNLTINKPGVNNVGMFGVTRDATISNLTLENADITGNNYVGMLIGKANSADVTDVIVSGNVDGNWLVGGLVGWDDWSGGATSFTRVEAHPHNPGDMVTSIAMSGGLMGRSDHYTTLEDCHSTLDVLSYHGRAGGLIGEAHGDISKCYATGNVAGNHAGSDYPANGGMSGGAGGLVGAGGFNVDQSFSTGDVSNNFSVLTGGFIGWANGNSQITNSYSVGAVTSSNPVVGGFIGDLSEYSTVDNSYGAGLVTATGSNSYGGFVANQHHNPVGTVTSSYWDEITTSISSTSGLGGSSIPTQGGASKYMTADFAQQINFVGWDFVDIWTIDMAPDGHTRPILQWQPADVGAGSSPFCGGHGTPASPWQICDADSLNAIAEAGTEYLADHFELTADLNLSGITYHIIGDYSTGSHVFSGSFNGNGHTISNLEISDTDGNPVGLFGFVHADGMIENLNLTNVDFVGAGETGALAAQLSGTAENIAVTGSVIGSGTNTGGIAGNLVGSLTNISFDGTVEANGGYGGGIVGQNSSGSISQASALGNISGSAGYIGGIAGNNNGLIEYTYSTNTVVGNEATGGLVGRTQSSSDIFYSYSTSSVTGNNIVGGLVGATRGLIHHSYASGLLESIDSPGTEGGLIGTDSGATVENSYWDVETTGTVDSDLGTGRTTAEFGVESGFTDWDFDSIWKMGLAPDGEFRPVFAGQAVATCDPAATPFGGGTGTIDDPYVICSINHLNTIGTEAEYLENNFILLTDIDLTATAFNIIGYAGDEFRGNFNGNNRTISNLVINDGTDTPVGLFGSIGSTGVVANLSLIDADITGTDYVGTIVGDNKGFVDNVRASGNVKGTASLGGIAGYNSGTVREAVSLVNVSNATPYSFEALDKGIGGIVGKNYGTIAYSYSAGAISFIDENLSVSPDYSMLGGIVGITYDGSIVEDSYSTSSVRGYAPASIAGMAYPAATIQRVYGAGQVSGTNARGDISRDEGIDATNIIYDNQTTAQLSGSGHGTPNGDFISPSPFEAAGWDFSGPWSVDIETADGFVRPTFGLSLGYTPSIVGALNCGSATVNGTAVEGEAINLGDVTIDIPYTAGNGGKHPRIFLGSESEELAGTILPGSVVNGNSTIRAYLAGTPSSDGSDSIIVTFAGHFCAVPITIESSVSFCGGSGTSGDPWQICSAEELNLVGADADLWGDYFVLMNDINMTELGATDYNIIGTEDNPFDGSFNGDGHTINNLTITREGSNYVGLFGHITGHVFDLHITNADIRGLHRVGAVAGALSKPSGKVGIIEGVSVQGYVQGTIAGGIVGTNDVGANLINSNSDIRLAGSNLGGAAGQNSGGILQNVHSTAQIEGTVALGGIAAENTQRGIIRYSSADVQISCDNNCATGGLVGVHMNEYSDIIESFASGVILADTDDIGAGGLVGLVRDANITNSYATTSVESARYNGSLVGHARGSESIGVIITNSYGTGKLMSSRSGGLIGEVHATDNNVKTVVVRWDIDTTGIAHPECLWGSDYDDCAGLPSDKFGDMGAQASIFPGWDFDDVWHYGEAPDGEIRPILQWQGGEIEPPAAPSFCGGDGSPGSPWQICTAEELNTIGTDPSLWSDHFALVSDIEMIELGGTPYNVIGTQDNPFNGVFDGRGRDIRQLTIAATGDDYIGLFGHTTGHIYDLQLVDVNIEGRDYVGGIAGAISQPGGTTGVIEGVSIGGTINGNTNVGGIVGYSQLATLQNSSSVVTVTASENVGGAIGHQRGGNSIDVHTQGAITASVTVGGLIGWNTHRGSISLSSSSADVVGKADGASGGLVGVHRHEDSVIDKSFASGRVEETDSGVPGGLVGVLQDATITNSYATGDVTGSGYAGSLVGNAVGNLTTAWIINSYGTGRVSGDRIGGLIGDIDDLYPDVRAESVRWDRDTTGIDVPRCLWDGAWDECVGHSTAAFGNDLFPDTYFPGWDFDAVWHYGEAPDGEMRPILQWQGGGISEAIVDTLACEEFGTLTEGEPASSVTIRLTYTNGNGGSYNAMNIPSIGVTGLTASVSAGNIDSGDGTLELTVSGTPSASGLARFGVSLGGQSCTADFSVEPASTPSPFCGGDGSPGSPWQICTAGELNAIGEDPDYWNQNFVLMADIDVAELGGPLNTIGTVDTPFSGIFNGNGYSIHNLKLESGGENNFGMFNYVHTDGELTNIQLVDVDVQCNWYCGVLAGHNNGTIKYAGITGILEAPGGMYVGGIAAMNYGYIFESFTNLLINGQQNVGSIAGSNNSGSIRTSFSVGEVNGSMAFGIAAQNSSGLIDQSYGAAISEGGPYSSIASGGDISVSVYDSADDDLGEEHSRTREEFARQETFEAIGWDFGSIWAMGTAPDGHCRPVHQWAWDGDPCVEGGTPEAIVEAVSCEENGTLVEGESASGVSIVVYYTNGNGGTFNAMSISSVDVDGLTASIGASTIETGDGSITLDVSGTPTTTGNAQFVVTLGGQSCVASFEVEPEPVPVCEPEIAKIATFNTFSMAYDNDGRIFTWGERASGAMGHLTETTDYPTPKQVKTWMGDKPTGIWPGYEHSFVVDINNGIYAAGANGDLNGVLGYDTGGANSPVFDKVDVLSDQAVEEILAVGAGEGFSVALTRSTGTGTTRLYSWGYDKGYGRLGHGGSPAGDIDKPTPIAVTSGMEIQQIAVGRHHTLAVDAADVLYTWGRNAEGQLGLGNVIDQNSPPTIVTTIPDPIDKIAAGWNHSLALDENGQLWGWGRNVHGQVGMGTTSDHEDTPLLISVPLEPGERIVKLAAGDEHSVALTSFKRIFVWGRGSEGQLGLNDDTSYSSPRLMPFLVGEIADIAAGHQRTMVLDSRGVIYVFGSGMLGLGGLTKTSRPTPLTHDLYHCEH